MEEPKTSLAMATISLGVKAAGPVTSSRPSGTPEAKAAAAVPVEAPALPAGAAATCRELVADAPDTLAGDRSIGSIVAFFESEAKHRSYPVVDGDGRLVGLAVAAAALALRAPFIVVLVLAGAAGALVHVLTG